jgi:hypothetical protein
VAAMDTVARGLERFDGMVGDAGVALEDQKVQ